MNSFRWLLLSCLILTMTVVPGIAQQVDFRYSPAYWYSAIGFPDDHHKTLVDDRGGLLYDFGPGPYVRPNTIVSIGLEGGELSRIDQSYADPRIPVVLTHLTQGSKAVHLKTYSLIPDDVGVEMSYEGKAWRTFGLTGSLAWGCTDEGIDPAFHDVAWGTNRPIEYHIRVAPGARKQVVFGLCESYRTKPGLRHLELRAEGASPLEVDPLETGARNTAQVFLLDAEDLNGDGELDLEVLAPRGDPNTHLSALWVFPAGVRIDQDALIRGALTSDAEVYVNAGREPQVLQRPTRFDVLEAVFDGKVTPRVTIRSRRTLHYDLDENILYADGIAWLKPIPAPIATGKRADTFMLTFAENTTTVQVLVQAGFESNPSVFPPLDNQVEEVRRQQYWLTDADIPFDVFEVPDPVLQDMLYASLRTMYQMRERVDGFLQFQPGAALYRGLWMHDGVYFADLALQLGDHEAARHILEGYLSFQHETGQVEVMRPATIHRETPLLIWMLCRYAALTQDDEWLKDRWNHVVRGVAWIQHLREQTLVPGAVNYGLAPAGFADGGIGGVQAEYATVNWILIALPKAIETARRFGQQEQVTAWTELYEAFLGSFHEAARRDVQRDAFGNLFLPIQVGGTAEPDAPQRGQWMIPEALMHGSYLQPQDTLVNSTIAMLEAEKVQDLVPSVGWMTDGIWAYYAGFLAEAYLLRGEGEKAIDLFYAMANHASPVSTWVEEQMPLGKGTRTAGDYPHAWASAMVPRMLIRMLALEETNELVLCSGLPTAWLVPGATTRLKEINTRFGSVDLSIQVSQTGDQIDVFLDRGRATLKGKMVLDMSSFEAVGFQITSSPETTEATTKLHWVFSKP